MYRTRPTGQYDPALDEPRRGSPYFAMANTSRPTPAGGSQLPNRQSVLGKSSRTLPRKIQLYLRDRTTIVGNVYLAEGQDLVLYLGSRKSGWINLVGVEASGMYDELNHAVFQTHQVLWASPIDNSVPLVHTLPSAVARKVEAVLEDGRVLRAGLFALTGQRLSDFLHTFGDFIPLVEVRLLPTGDLLGDLAVNRTAIRFLAETGAPPSRPTPTSTPRIR
jgi:hypothetical protein